MNWFFKKSLFEPELVGIGKLDLKHERSGFLIFCHGKLRFFFRRNGLQVLLTAGPQTFSPWKEALLIFPLGRCNNRSLLPSICPSQSEHEMDAPSSSSSLVLSHTLSLHLTPGMGCLAKIWPDKREAIPKTLSIPPQPHDSKMEIPVERPKIIIHP